MRTNLFFYIISVTVALNVQNSDTIYFVKNNRLVNKQSIKETDIDSIIFYRTGNDDEINNNLDSLALQPYCKNPNYWQYNGRPILLFGGSETDNIFQWAGVGSKLTDHLDLLSSCGGNYLRCTMSSREYTLEGYRWDMFPYPYARMNGKYNLSVWNEEYWNKFRTFLQETKNRGIIVQVEVWDRWNESGRSDVRIAGDAGWFESPYNPNNNSTYSWESSPLLIKGIKTPFYNEFHLAANTNDPVLLPVQQQFINRIVDEVMDNGFNHVLFQIDNESGIGDATLEPDPYWANYIRQYAQSKDSLFPVYVCSSRRFHPPAPYLTLNFQDWNNPEIRVSITNSVFNYCDISQNNGNSGQAHYNNFIWYRDKVHENGIRPINCVKCYHFNWHTGADFNQERISPPDHEAFSKFWRVIFAGGAAIRFHRDTPYKPGGLRDGFGLSSEAQVHIKSLRMLIEEINIFSMEPNNTILAQRTNNEAYCLAEPGKQYAVFFTGEGDKSVQIDFGSSGKEYELRWLDINENKWINSPDNLNSRYNTLTPPSSGGQWVAVIQ